MFVYIILYSTDGETFIEKLLLKFLTRYWYIIWKDFKLSTIFLLLYFTENFPFIFFICIDIQIATSFQGIWIFTVLWRRYLRRKWAHGLSNLYWVWFFVLPEFVTMWSRYWCALSQSPMRLCWWKLPITDNSIGLIVFVCVSQGMMPFSLTKRSVIQV